MFRKIIIPLLAIMGIGFAIFMIYYGSITPPIKTIPFPPPTAPYKDFIAGEGIVESLYKNISVSVPFPELITNVYIEVGDIVKQGDPLFKLDTRTLEAQHQSAQEALLLAEKDYDYYTEQFNFYERLNIKSAVSEQIYNTAFYNKILAQQKVAVAKAAVHVIAVNIERSTIYAPINGEILQKNIRVGQYANSNPFDQQPLILFGNTNFYHLRIDIDEEDAWRKIKNAPATAFIRGNSRISIPLNYVYSEPYIIPKKSLSGSTTERNDTRVLQVVYSFEKNNYPIYCGQLLDVYIQAEPSEAK